MTTSPTNGPPIPNLKLNITTTTITAKPRTLKMKWSSQTAQDIQALWGIDISRPDNALDLLNDALDDPNYDPSDAENYKGRWRWPDGRIATPEEVKQELRGSEAGLIESMANEMSAEIDREIMKDLKELSGS